MSNLRRFKAYPAYRDSGVEWLGEIPGHWEVKPLKHVAGFVNGFAFKPDEWGLDGTPIIRIENLNGGGGFNFTMRSLPAKYCADEGDLLFGWSGNRGTSFGPFLWWRPGKHYVNQHIFRIVDYDVDRLWLYRALQGVTSYVEKQAHGIIGMVHVTRGELGTLPIPVLPCDEQRAIAAFLDRETARIDALVAKKERLIELLQEKRTALITRAVTKGLDPNVPMKDSGVEWLGEIPAHWEVTPLKAASALQTGVTLGKKYDAMSLARRPYLRVANVQDGYLDLEDVAELELPVEDTARYELRDGDVLMTEGGDFDKLGRGHVWEGQVLGCLHQNHIFAVRPRRETLSPRYLAHAMSSGYGRAYFTATSKQSTNLASTNSTKLRNLPLPMPVLSEQNQIVAEIDRETARIDVVVSKVHQAIDRLRELRTALISAAVTGKIDVRGEVA
jgi:type I restriction enzyme S subunit